MLRDLHSRNGVFLNGRRITQAPLKVRDVLRFGEWVGVLVALPTRDAAEPSWGLEEIADAYWAGPQLRSRLAAAQLIAATELSIVVQGETGAGKEGVARAIHVWSGRRGPFLAVNCSTVPEALAEAELFGYRKGAFSGADRASPGFLRAAERGTLFLDEIGDLPTKIQPKLLRAIEAREVIPLGETRPVSTDVRLVAATHVRLSDAVSKDRFRHDLFARLKGFIVEIPPLRERVEDVPLLFIELLAKRCPADRRPGLDPGFVEALCLHNWPYNMRDLTTLVVRLLALHPGVKEFDKAMLVEMLDQDQLSSDEDAGRPIEPERSEPDQETFLTALRRNNGNIRKAALDLGISRGRAYRMLGKMDTSTLATLRR